LCFNPLTDYLINEKGEKVMLTPPAGYELPPFGFDVKDAGLIEPDSAVSTLEVEIDPTSGRLQKLQPFQPWDGKDLLNLCLLIKAKGKCTTDHISMAGPWLQYRGHLDKISDNLLMGAVNTFNDQTNAVLDPSNGEYIAVSTLARKYKSVGKGSIVVAEENYGEGSSREHAAMEPRFLNVKTVLVKSFARIHETNLKKQGVLALTFKNKKDYDKIREDDHISILGLEHFTPEKPLTANLTHSDGTTEHFEVNHTYNQFQIDWFKAGSALNALNI
ncbi:MAG TPA: aconitate hydratase, partial [Bacteroidales bacterium]